MAISALGAVSIGLITVFDAILTGRQSGQKLQCLYGNTIAYNFFQNRIFSQFLNRNVKILGRRLHSPSLKDVAWLEDVQLIFLIFHTFVCNFGLVNKRLDAIRGKKKLQTNVCKIEKISSATYRPGGGGGVLNKVLYGEAPPQGPFTILAEKVPLLYTLY